MSEEYTADNLPQYSDEVIESTRQELIEMGVSEENAAKWLARHIKGAQDEES